MLHKLGIFTASDLLFYFPRKHIDYSERTKIKDFEEGKTITVFGHIKQTECYVTHNGLGVVKVKISDETGSFEINFFYAKCTNYSLAIKKRFFPKGAGIIISGTVAINSYNGKYALKNTSHSIMPQDFFKSSNDVKENLNVGRIVPFIH